MPPRRRKRVRSSSEEASEDDTVAASLQARPVGSSRKPGGVSADALQKEPHSLQQPEHGPVVGVFKPKPGGDIIERRMEQYLDAGLQAAFAPAAEDDEKPADSHAEGSSEDAAIYQTKAIAEVSVPGFNTAITEYRLDPDASKQGTQAAAGKPRTAPPRHKPSDKKLAPRGQDAGKEASASYVPRQQFPRSFGKQRPAGSRR